jgi:hypothetical protein
LIAALKTADVAFWLGLYASVVSSAVALITLYGYLFNRVRVVAREDFRVLVEGGTPVICHGEDSLDAMGLTRDGATEVLTIGILNRGRQTVQIGMVSKAHPVQRSVFPDLPEQLPVTIEPGHSKTVIHGKEGNYSHGDLKNMRRFFVADGAGRIYPYRERWRQRLENLLYRRLVLWSRSRT